MSAQHGQNAAVSRAHRSSPASGVERNDGAHNGETGMSQTFECGDNTVLVGYMYGECEPAERAAIEAHIAVCPACAAELASLESTRIQLASWIPPGVNL